MASFENPKGLPGEGGKENHGAKGRPFRSLAKGQAQTLLDTDGPGIVNRMWLTVRRRDPETLRALRLACYWDHEEKPAVDVPLGDFFMAASRDPLAYETVFLSNPEGRSFVSHFTMPFLRHARIVLYNGSQEDLSHLFYDVSYELCDLNPDEILYFHSFWNSERPVRLGRDYTVLPRLEGEGKYLGAFFSVKTDPAYGKSWFGEGEVKVYLDGDGAYPTICGTGTEDYIGTAWGQGTFIHRTQGSLISAPEDGLFNFYRFHAEDPIHFYQDIQVRIQDMGGAPSDLVAAIRDRGAAMEIVTGDLDGAFTHLYQTGFDGRGKLQPGWYNFYREDCFESTCYFDYAQPSSALPPLPDPEARKAVLRP